MPEIRDRITVVETVYYQPQGDDATAIDGSYSRELNSHEQIYRRNCEVGEEWEPLDSGWIDRAGLLVVKNTEGLNQQRMPTGEEKEELKRKVLQIAYKGEEDCCWLIPPGESMRGLPSHIKCLVVRCKRGTCSFSVHVIPD